MKKILLSLFLCLFLVGCGNNVSQEEYNKVVSERDAYKSKYETLLDEYAENKVENLTREIQEQIDKEGKNEKLEDYISEEPYFSYKGIGDDVVTGVVVEKESYAHITSNDTHYFSVKGHYGGSYDLLVSTTDAYDGDTLVFAGNEYTFEVSGRGEWTIELYELGTSSEDSFEGNSDYVTPLFLSSSDIYEVETVGKGYFSVKGWIDGKYDLLVSTTDENYSGKVMFDSKNKYAFFEITGGREWSIKPIE